MSLLIIGLCGQSVFLGVDHFHRPEETLHALSLFTEPGGKGYNQAVAAGRMGAQVTFAGAVGCDADADVCAERLQREGIRHRMFTKPGRTAYAVILTDAKGENRVTVFSGAQMSEEDVRTLEPAFDEASMILLTPEIPEEAFAQAVRMAKEKNLKIVINPAPFFPWVKPYLSDAWLVTPNRSEACAMLDCEEDELTERLQEGRYPRVAMTLGRDGALCFEDGLMTHIPAEPAQALDTTGAGDCFNGVLCAFVLEGYPLQAAARRAVCAASLSVEQAHALDGMPRREQLSEQNYE